MANTGYLDTVVMTFKRLNFWRSVKCEFMMTLFYVLFGCGATSSVLAGAGAGTKDFDAALTSQYASALNAALAFGLTAAIMLHCSLRLEGPVHLNPAVTIALLCTRRVNVVTAVFHVMAQCLGALAGSGVLYGVTPARLHDHLGVTMVMGNTGRGQAFGFEFVSTFVLVFAYYSSCEPGTLRFKPLPIGLAISAGTLFSVYWVGPILGGMLGGITYEYSHWSGTDTPGSGGRRFSCPGAAGIGLEHSGSKDSVEDTPTELTYTVNDDPEV